MATDERRIVIELKLNGESGNTSLDETVEETDLSKLLKTIQHPIASLENATLGKSAILYSAFQQGKQLAKSAALYFVGRRFNLTENYKAEQDLSNTFSILSHVAEGAGSIVGGMILGAKAGPIGMIVGGVVGGVTWGVNTALNSYQAWDQQTINLNTMRMQSSYQKVRLGLIDDGRGTQN